MAKQEYLVVSDHGDGCDVEKVVALDVEQMRSYSVEGLKPDDKFSLHLAELNGSGTFELSNKIKDKVGAINLELFELAQLKYILDIMFKEPNMMSPYTIYKAESNGENSKFEKL